MGGDGSTGGHAWRVCKPFVNGGIAGSIGIGIMQPMDLSERCPLAAAANWQFTPPCLSPPGSVVRVVGDL